MLNKIQLIGYVGADPEVRYTGTGNPVTNFSLATTRKWKTREGASEKRTDWHKIVCWDRLGEIAGQYLCTGRLIYVEGRLHTERTEKRGHVFFYTEVVAYKLQFLDAPGGHGARTADDYRPPTYGRNYGPTPAAPQPAPTLEAADDVEYDDDIPF